MRSPAPVGFHVALVPGFATLGVAPWPFRDHSIVSGA
jgi:hypothetical protein